MSVTIKTGCVGAKADNDATSFYAGSYVALGSYFVAIEF